jgi:hypothetical protein
MLDLAIQYLGSAEGVFALAQLNGLAVTDRPAAGSTVLLPEVVDRRTRQQYVERGYEPAVGVETEDGQGIGYWTIGENFIVS